MTPPIIKNVQALASYMKKLEDLAIKATSPASNRVTVKSSINEHKVECRSTYTTRKGVYVLFYVDDLRTSRANLPRVLGVS